ncbi:Alf1p KNAG_0H03620 [Huiozyma naganishii CBS 8797]|uniref:CAP-Gly domain-containing protein n=1 Tax=Huiozyma naganishii (strain ATCC MYA-139 / BCRC 22969 / CBS 8797 / KCTC 17520 / NBRC 10181 / NCYC 3082 / Yp74L-3) TaxID=1071383 RepID=J7S9X7_HUIN7|nr:hypothetical protein KNAG_0H03620 [Kazachstania naganishii CBS 8797]CCK71776.1 hypothetical protein KNAG_0H03620 [Kazachstania naganishii CBS 8797]
MVTVFVDSALCSTSYELDDGISLETLVSKLKLLTGIEVEDMKLTLQSRLGGEGESIVYPTRDLGHDFAIRSVARIMVEDTNSDSLVNALKESIDNRSRQNASSFSLSEEQYSQKQNSVLQWKKQAKLGRFDPKYSSKRAIEDSLIDDRLKELEVGQRCCVTTGNKPNQLERRGWLRFIGKVPDISETDIWCGIEFDDAVGKNEGAVKGTTYFGPVAKNHGGFLKPLCVHTGSEFTPRASDDTSDEEV